MTKKLLLLFVLLPMVMLAQHSIKGTFSPAKSYEWAILYKVTPTTSIYVQNTTVNDEGKFEFELDSTIPKGIYRIVYALPQEEFNFDIIYNAKENIELTFHKMDGVDYKVSKENQIFNSYMKSMNLVNQTINNYYSDGKNDKKAFNSIFKTLKDTQGNFEKAAQGTIAYNFIHANAPYIPESVEDVKAYSKNLKASYFNKVDFNNNMLQSSNFLIERVLSYVFGMNSDPSDEKALQASIDDVAARMKTSNPELQKTLLEIVWQQLVEFNFEASANYLSENYLLGIAKATNDDELKTDLVVHKNTSIGAKAPDFSWKTEVKGKKKTKQLSGLDTAQYYAIMFWSSTCSHCMEELPELKKYVSKLEKGKLKVIAVGLEEEPFRWNNETAYYPDFIHVYGEGKWDNEIGNNYGVTATPTYFILDKDKKIIDKPYEFKDLKAFVGKQKMPKKETSDSGKKKGEDKIAPKKKLPKTDKSH